MFLHTVYFWMSDAVNDLLGDCTKTKLSNGSSGIVQVWASQADPPGLRLKGVKSVSGANIVCLCIGFDSQSNLDKFKNNVGSRKFFIDKYRKYWQADPLAFNSQSDQDSNWGPKPLAAKPSRSRKRK